MQNSKCYKFDKPKGYYKKGGGDCTILVTLFNAITKGGHDCCIRLYVCIYVLK